MYSALVHTLTLNDIALMKNWCRWYVQYITPQERSLSLPVFRHFFSLLPPPGILIPPLFLIPAWTTMSAYSVHPHPTHTLTNMRFLHRSLPSFLSSPSSLPSPVGNPVQCDCGCPSWKLWWWLWLLCSEARIVPASLCVCLCVVWVPVCVCVCVCVACTLHKHSTTVPSVRPPAGLAREPRRHRGSVLTPAQKTHITHTHT